MSSAGLLTMVPPPPRLAMDDDTMKINEPKRIMSLPGPAKVEAELSSSKTAPGTAPPTGIHIERMLEDGCILATRERSKIIQTQKKHTDDLEEAKKERLKLSHKIGTLTRDIRDTSRQLPNSATQPSRVQTLVCEKFRRRRDLKQQKATCDQQVEYHQDEIFLLDLREKALSNQITRLTTQMLDIESTNKILREKREHVRQKNINIDAAAKVVREKQEYIRRTRNGMAGANKVISEKQEYLDQTSKAAKAELDALTQSITSSAASA
ncbi:hypothetical protein C2857_004558 [Epichloe festucae Fl1]|uniref:Uncharacterized protein n=1 Tax=Epichloe festucae (strain Fl1) TaxID=877507 RepID=A0A7S9KP53_EPIFF|nr:hypothetical protein C2857_004558 [Epichloe festucae Fl1]